MTGMDKGENMITSGCHLSSSKGYAAMGKEAVKINANTFQFFTRNPRGGKAKEIDPEDVSRFLAFAGEQKFPRIGSHFRKCEILCGNRK